LTNCRSFIFFEWVGPAHMLFSGCDNLRVDLYIGYDIVIPGLLGLTILGVAV